MRKQVWIYEGEDAPKGSGRVLCLIYILLMLNSGQSLHGEEQWRLFLLMYLLQVLFEEFPP